MAEHLRPVRVVCMTPSQAVRRFDALIDAMFPESPDTRRIIAIHAAKDHLGELPGMLADNTSALQSTVTALSQAQEPGTQQQIWANLASTDLKVLLLDRCYALRAMIAGLPDREYQFPAEVGALLYYGLRNPEALRAWLVAVLDADVPYWPPDEG